MSDPMPIPGTTRHAASCTIDVTKADISMPTHIRTRLMSTTLRLPNLSPSGAMKQEPSAMPTNPLERASPSAAFPTTNSALPPGAATVTARPAQPSTDNTKTTNEKTQSEYT